MSVSVSTKYLLQKYRGWTDKFTRSNFWKECVICGSFPAEIHHLRSIADLRKRSENADWISSQMAAINRKQVPLCKIHHDKVHGKLGGLSQGEMF
jgi:hypothetical protein